MNVPPYLKNLLSIASKSESNVLITGDTGTGKTSLARQIHENSQRKGKPFVTVNLAALHEGTLESELFGHERGSFTGADQKRVGRLEIAQGGTVFLDEIGELSLRLQARLLDFLQFRVITPVGSSREVKLDVRVIAATHKNLPQAIANKTFREDLFHRIRVISISMKSLKERAEDFDEILHDSLEDLSIKLGRSIHKISIAVAEKLESYEWPGNIRELRNVLEYAVLAAERDELELHDLPLWFLVSEAVVSNVGSSHPAALGVAEVPLSLNYQETVSRFEREYLKRALNRHGGRVSRTARQIGLNKTTLLRRIRAYDIPLS